MPRLQSPGVEVIIKDISDYAPSINSSVVGVVGFASKGEPNKAILVTSPESLRSTFGPPQEAITGQALEASLEMLETTDQMYFVRALDSTVGADASAFVQLGACPAIAVSGSTADTTWGASFGIGRNLLLRVQVWDNQGIAQYAGAGRDFVIGASTIAATDTSASQGLALRKKVGGDLETDKVGIFYSGTAGATPAATTNDSASGVIVGLFAGSASMIAVTSIEGTTYNEANGVSALAAIQPETGNVSSQDAFGVVMFASSVSAAGSTFRWGSEGAAFLAESLWNGAGYDNGTTTAGDTSGNSVEVDAIGSDSVYLTVNEDGGSIETFKVSMVSGVNFITDKINTGTTNLKSRVIKGNMVSGAANTKYTVTKNATFDAQATILLGYGTGPLVGTTKVFTLAGAGSTPVWGVSSLTEQAINPRYVKLIQGTYGLSGGNNGIPTTEAGRATALIGNANVTPKTGMQALDDDALNISLAVVPGISTQSVQNGFIALAEQSQNFLAIVSPPYGVGTTQDAVDWHNGRSTSRTAAINNRWAAIYWPWVQVFSVADGKDIWLDPVTFGARQMTYTDSVAEPWFAPAGLRRGKLSKPSQVEVKLNRGDLNTLQGDGNNINPIVNFEGDGIVIWGQKTSQREPTALDRVNVMRLVIVLRKIILRATRRFVFEPNDRFLWAEIENVLNPILDDIGNRRGLSEFRVRCDETVNTGIRQDRNEMWCRVIFKPIKSAEKLFFELNLTSQSADLGNF